MADARPATDSGPAAPPADQTYMLQEILGNLQTLQQSHRALAASVESIEGRVNAFVNVRHVNDAARHPSQGLDKKLQNSPALTESHLQGSPALIPLELTSSPKSVPTDRSAEGAHNGKGSPAAHSISATTSSKITLTTYPHQSGIDPIIMNWGDTDPMQRGPVVVSRAPSTIRRRNGK